ncbi:hypothetical protein [Actinomyces faecalis]|uniref:hypothetical protein n=1 Tax=Actinomyces faecalis TaxID=2722820 RepID=UPI00155767CE|nr:hypothetical protein [Actinomyces faecalis]
MTEPGPSDASLDEFFRASQDQEPQSDLPVGKVAERVAKRADERMRDAEAVRVEQANKLREWFFIAGISLAGACVATSIIISIWLTCTNRMTETIAVAFITGLTIEVVGIVAIMAKYLFPAYGDTLAPQRSLSARG